MIHLSKERTLSCIKANHENPIYGLPSCYATASILLPASGGTVNTMCLQRHSQLMSKDHSTLLIAVFCLQFTRCQNGRGNTKSTSGVTKTNGSYHRRISLPSQLLHVGEASFGLRKRPSFVFMFLPGIRRQKKNKQDRLPSTLFHSSIQMGFLPFLSR
ncbi:hypothetical protein TNCT_434171 [Trichonephila clavata]|uniref:Uncharacterized protein n=1 Tax=Trichonephila clavata TaxID=2740835 RepID=A0A8X6LEH2_TRICU|nr:hypothetical protein TNCT_434171 [Trichonephila clavata]